MKNLLLILSFCYSFSFLNAQTTAIDPFGTEVVKVAETDNYNHLPKFVNFAQSFDPKAHQITSVEPVDLNSLMETHNRMFILDIRETVEFEVSHIQGAKQISYQDFAVEKVWMLDKNVTAILYSTDGERCLQVAAYMQSMGFADVRVINGSLIGWVNAGYSVVDKEGKNTKDVLINNKEEAHKLKKGKAVHR